MRKILKIYLKKLQKKKLYKELYLPKRIRIAMANKIKRIPITIKNIFKIFVKLKSVSLDILLTVVDGVFEVVLLFVVSFTDVLEFAELVFVFVSVLVLVELLVFSFCELVIAIASFLLGCSGNKKENTLQDEEGTPVINLSSDNVSKVALLPLSEAAAKVEIVSLEVTDESLIGEITKMKVTDSDIWVKHYKDNQHRGVLEIHDKRSIS